MGDDDAGDGPGLPTGLALARVVPAGRRGAALVVGEALASLCGYESGSDDLAPWWVSLVAGGRPVAKVPMYVGTGLVALFVLLNLVSYVVGALTEG